MKAITGLFDAMKDEANAEDISQRSYPLVMNGIMASTHTQHIH